MRLKPLGSPTTAGFLPEDYIQRKAENRSNAISLVLFGVVMFCVIGAFLVTNRQWSTVRARQADINQQYAAETKKIEQLKTLEAQKAEMMEKAEITTGLIERVPRSILLAELINRMPDRVVLTEVQLASKRVKDRDTGKADPKKKDDPKAKSLAGKGAPKGGKAKEAPPPEKPRPPRLEFTMALNGLAASDEDVADFQSGLRACGLLDRVDVVSSQATTVDEVPMRKFRIEAAVRVDADARRIEPLLVPRRNPYASGRATGARQAAADEPRSKE